MRFLNTIITVCSVSALHDLDDDSRAGMVDPARYESVFSGPDGRISNLIQVVHKPSLKKKELKKATPGKSFLDTVYDSIPSLSFVQTRDWSKFFAPFSTVEAAKAASVKLAASEESLSDREAMTKSKIDAFKNEIQLQIDEAKKEKKSIDERMAQRGSSFAQLRTDFARKELEKINELSRQWKVDAERIAHAELASMNEPNAAVVAATTKVEADKKKMNRINAAIEKDLAAVENDEAVVAAQQNQLRKHRQMEKLINE